LPRTFKTAPNAAEAIRAILALALETDGGLMDRNLLRVIAKLPKGEQDAAIDSLVDAIMAEGLTEEEVEKLQLAVGDLDGALDHYGRPN
jgi:adenine-specific DNA glycosylase